MPGKVVHRETGALFDLCQRPGNAARLVAGDHEPHIQAVLAPVVMRHAGERVDLFGHLLIAARGNFQRRQRHFAAEPFGIEQRAETAQQASLQQIFDGLDQRGFPGTEAIGNLREGASGQREATLKPVDEIAFECAQRVHGEVSMRVSSVV